MHDYSDLIDTYLAAYCEPDASRRRELITSAFHPDAVLADPPFIATGHAELDAAFAGLLEQFPDHRFDRTSAVDGHHDTVRYGWALRSPGGEVAVSGMDVADINDGKITRVTGFFGDLIGI